jgi:hypothetical protein
MLQRSLAEYSAFYEMGGVGHGRDFGTIDLNAGIHAEGIFTYLNMLIDDLVRLVPILFNKPGLSVQVFSGRPNEALKKQQDLFPEIAPLLTFDDEHSWWHMAFKRGHGLRQRIIHYPDIVQFQGCQRQGENKVEMLALLISPDSTSGIDYLNHLRVILDGFCNWLYFPGFCTPGSHYDAIAKRAYCTNGKSANIVATARPTLAAASASWPEPGLRRLPLMRTTAGPMKADRAQSIRTSRGGKRYPGAAP